MLTRAARSASRTARAAAVANVSGSGVSAPDVGVNLVSILKRTWSAFACRTRSNTSINVGMRTPSIPLLRKGRGVGRSGLQASDVIALELRQCERTDRGPLGGEKRAVRPARMVGV